MHDHRSLPPLATKFLPPQLSLTLVHRERLLRNLDAASASRLVLLSASAGSGKTTLLAVLEEKLSKERLPT